MLYKTPCKPAERVVRLLKKLYQSLLIIIPCIVGLSLCICDHVCENQPYVSQHFVALAAVFAEVLPDGPLLQMWSQLLILCPRYILLLLYMLFKNKHFQNSNFSYVSITRKFFEI